MKTNASIFTNAARIFVVATGLSLVAGVVTGCGKSEKQEAKESEDPLVQYSLDNLKSDLQRLSPMTKLGENAFRER